MPLFPSFYAECLAYVYPSKAQAKKDTAFLAVGFFVSVPSKRSPVHHYDYFVTNEHVVRDFDPIVIRVNTHRGCEAMQLPQKRFLTSKRFDLAIAYIDLPEANYTHISEPAFVGLKEFTQFGIGLGDDIAMISRILHKTKYTKRNQSAMRFGNISLLPQFKEIFYMVEMRSVAGHSGSPVMVYEGPEVFEGLRTPEQTFAPMLLGINRGHLRDYETIVRISDKKTPHPKYVAETNMAMSQVVPAWYISQLLHDQKFEQHRMRLEARLDRRPSLKLDKLPPWATVA